MDYQKASSIRKKSLLQLIAENKFQQGRGIGSSIGGAISSKFKARAMGAKEALDPLNWVRKLTGKGVIGDIATTMAGRAFGRSDKDISYFGGYKRKKKRTNKDPQFTSVAPGVVQEIRVGDSVADILGKTYNFMKMSYERDKLNDEIQEAFIKEQKIEDEKRHEKLIDAVLGRKKTKDGEKTENTFFEKLLSTMKNIILAPLKIILSIVESIGSVILNVVTNMITSVVTQLTLFVSSAFSMLAISLGKKLSQLLIRFGIIEAGKGIGSLIGGKGGGKGGIGFGWIGAAIGGAMGLAAAGDIIQESINGKDYIDAIEQYNKLPTTPENDSKRKQIRDKAENDRAEYQKNILIPFMEEMGYKAMKKPGEIERPEDFKNNEGKIAGIPEILSAYLSSEAYSGGKTLKQKGLESVEQIKNNATSYVSDAYKSTGVERKINQLRDYLSSPDLTIPDILPDTPTGNESDKPDVVVNNKVSSIGGKSNYTDMTPIDPRISNDSIRVAQVTSTVAV